MVMTGGFHTENLCELLRKQGISYVSILPKFTSEKDYESPYFQLLAGQTTDVQQFLRSALAQASSAAAMMQVASMNSKELAEAVWGRSSVEAYRDEIALRTILEEWAGLHGPQGAQVTVTQDGKELFTVSKGSNPSANRITFDIAQLEGVADRLNRTVNDEIIDPKIRVAMEAGSFETLTDENEAVKAAVEFFRVQAKAKGIAGTPAARELNKVADALEALAKEGKVSLLTGVTGFSGHAGGRGIYINKAAVTDIASLTGLIIHEAVAGFSHLHSISHIAEQLYLKAKDVTSESLAKIGEKGNMRELAVWDVRVSPEERWVGGRDIAAAGKAEPPQVLVAEGETNAIAGKMETYFMVDGKKGTIAPMGAKVVREMLEAG